MNIVGNDVLLRAIENTDKYFLMEMVNDPVTESLIGGWSWPISITDQEQWIERERTNTATKRFVIETMNNPVGLIVLANIDWKNRSAFTGIKLHPGTQKSTGIGTSAMIAIQKYAFEELQLHRLETTWLEYNEASERLHKKCGWQIEGTARLAVYKNGKYHNLIYGAILASDYFEKFSNE